MSLDHVIQILQLHPASFTKIFPDRKINNVYFDTPNMTCLNDNLSGVARRKKFRVRWYGEDTTTINHPVLEIKYKENELGGKKNLPVEDFDLNDLERSTKAVNQLLFNRFSLIPALLNSYYRSYWMSADGQFRITIDADLCFHALRHSPAFMHYVKRDQAIILELKYDQDLDNEVKNITRFLPFRLSKNSKYVNGIFLTR